MPDQLAVVVRGSCEDGLTYPRQAELVGAARGTVDGDEKEGALSNPSRNFVRKSSTLRQIHSVRLRLAYPGMASGEMRGSVPQLPGFSGALARRARSGPPYRIGGWLGALG